MAECEMLPSIGWSCGKGSLRLKIEEDHQDKGTDLISSPEVIRMIGKYSFTLILLWLFMAARSLILTSVPYKYSEERVIGLHQNELAAYLMLNDFDKGSDIFVTHCGSCHRMEGLHNDSYFIKTRYEELGDDMFLAAFTREDSLATTKACTVLLNRFTSDKNYIHHLNLNKDERRQLLVYVSLLKEK